ncbi:MAG: hypothetical protein ACXU9B_01295 [Reyranella sp.]
MPTPNDPPAASLTFLPWVRQGVAATINTPDTLGARQRAVVDLSAAIKVNASTTPSVTMNVRLRGPADVVGIDSNQVIRMDPHPGTSDFEPNYFPCVEFDRPDFPWLFTPASPAANAKLRPWLCLVVVRKQDGVTLASTPDSPLPVLQIAAPALPASELPDLSECWAWVHAQAAGDDSTEGPVRNALNGPPERSLSRLICPRILAPNTDYIACVVPTFDLGRKAGLGIAIQDKDLIAATALTAAWSLAPPPAGQAPAPVVLPVYHHWEFRTGSAGDFASLAARLRPRPAPPELGHRPFAIGAPGFDLPQGFPVQATLEVQGALRPMPPKNTPDVMPPWPDKTLPAFQDKLAAIVNAPGIAAELTPGTDPILAPPLYGDCYAGRRIVSTTGSTSTTWLDQLNLDPRLRSVAAFGTRVIQEHQEALMASAWEQAGELQRVNQRMRQLQMSMTVANRIQVRHFTPMNDEAALRINAPVLGRIGLSTTPGSSMLAMVKTSSIPVRALSPSMRRIGRQRGPLTRRMAAQGNPRSAAPPWVAALAAGSASLPVPTWFDLSTVSSVAQHTALFAPIMSYASVTDQVVANRGGMPWFVVRPEGQPVPIAYSFQYLTPQYDSPSARAFRKAATDHLKRVNPGRTYVSHVIVTPPTLTQIRSGLSQQSQPVQAVAALARRVVSASAPAPSSAIRAFAARMTATANTTLDTITVTPTFPQPMYAPLRDLSQDLLLPGLESVPPDTVLGLETNRRFVEAYIVGLNVEMGRELLWRGFPTNQLGTYFDHFWGGGADIKPLHTWGTRPLADPPNPAPRENFVMLLRGALLRRYPNALIYLTPAVGPPTSNRVPSEVVANEKPPVFTGAVQPDITFFGFDITPDRAVGSGTGTDQGYYVVIQQHPTEPRFGLDAGLSLGNASHLSIASKPAQVQVPTGLTWGRNGAHMAAITRRRPVRLAIHASQFQSSLKPPPAVQSPASGLSRPPVIGVATAPIAPH